MQTAAGPQARATVPTRRSEWDVAVRLTVDRRGDTASVERVVRRKIAWLRRHFPEITSCRVTVDVPHRRQRGGRLHHVRVGVVLRGSVVQATRNPSLATHEDALVAVHDAFAAAHRELTDCAHRREEERRTR